MGKRCRFVKPEKVRIGLSQDDWIEVRKKLSVGEQRAAVTSFVGVYTRDGGRTPNLETLGMGQTLAYLIAWSLHDDEDRPVDISLDSLKALDPRDYAEIEAAINKHIEAVDAEDEAREKKVPASTAPASSPTS